VLCRVHPEVIAPADDLARPALYAVFQVHDMRPRAVLFQRFVDFRRAVPNARHVVPVRFVLLYALSAFLRAELVNMPVFLVVVRVRVKDYIRG